MINKIHTFTDGTKRLLLGVFAALLVSGVITPTNSQTVQASSIGTWNAGNIISDGLFFNKGAMSVADIQNFLNQRVPVCDTWGTQIYSGSQTRAQYGASRGYPAPYTCLKDYYENPTTHANNLSGNPVPSGGVSAAQIIWNVSQTYNVSPEVLLVTLQKESLNLMGDDWPWPSQYRVPMGYGCPDTAPCDSQYFGFYNQMQKAAWQFRRYATYPSEYRYKAGQVNSIQYNPNIACGSSNVYIENQATAGLYNYTPYQPNQAALDAGYGEASCGAYGNRNFWLYYYTWFGSSLVRTVSNSTVYLIVDSNKYPIADINVLNDFSALGPVRFVNDSYISNKTTGGTLGHMVGGPTSTLYFVTSGIKLPFTSCSQVTDFGYSCGSVINLSQSQLNKLASGPNMTNRYKTRTGRDYYISGGEKREVFDTQALINNSLPTSSVTLRDHGINYLPYGDPVLRDNALITSRQDGKKYLTQSGAGVRIPNDIANQNRFKGLSSTTFDNQSIQNLSSINTSFVGFAQDSSSNKYVLDQVGKIAITDASRWTNTYTTLSDSFLAGTQNSSQPVNNGFIKPATRSTLYLVNDKQKYSITRWSDFINLHDDKSSSWSALANTTVDSLSGSSSVFAPGALIKSSNNATVYVVNGLLSKTPLSSFQISRDIGLSGVRVVNTQSLNAHTTDSTVLGNFIECDSKDYLANRGTLYEIDAGSVTKFGYGSITAQAWDALGCRNLNISSTALSSFDFLKGGSSNTIYYLDNGEKRPVGSISKYIELGADGTNLLVASDRVLNTVPTGAVIN